MPDTGERATEREYRALRDKFEEIYRQAYSEVTQKALDFARGYAARDAKYSAAVAAGKMSKADYRAWKMGQVFQGNQWRARVQQMQATMLDADNSARGIINRSRFDVFAANANSIGYSIERDAGASIGFTLYSAESVARLLRDEPDLLPPRKEVGKDASYAWYNKQIQNAVIQGIIQGESINKIALRIGKQTGESNLNAMLRNARTMMTGAQNAGRLEAMKQAQDLGVEVQKEWIATLDRRTRSSHANLDGDVADIDKPFHSELGEIMFPGDPDADPDNVWNCRCTLGYSYPDSQSFAMRRDNETDESIEDMDYQEWLAMKGGDVPEDAGEEEYREYREDQYDEEYRRLLEEYNQKMADAQNAINEINRMDRNSPLYKQKVAEYTNLREEASDILSTIDNQYAIEKAADEAKSIGIEYKPIGKAGNVPGESEIIARLAGGDMTSGSCASLGFCYAGQKAGYDVLDFRGGESQNLFSRETDKILRSMIESGADAITGTAQNYVTAGKRALLQAEQGKEYYFSCGRHAAIVRRSGDSFQYLELQSSTANGWKSFSEGNIRYVLSNRFGANVSRSGAKSYMVNVDDIARDERFLKILGYINTDEDKQRKGAAGFER